MEPEPDFTKLRYALYVRKSTDDPQRQLRSIPDQIAECEEFADRIGIKIIRPYLKETKSAKKPGQRKVFTDLLRDLRKGKYDGILAWHPDRLARNMKEGGELIDMIDEGIIKDLKFVTHHFTNDANGKMLLGMSFVLSKQYSDDLSQKVTRGMRRGFQEGKSSGTPKHGYIRTEHGDYQPDGKNFELVCEAWQMRLAGTGLRPISDYMNENGYGRIIKSKTAKNRGKVIKMSPQTLSDLFRDPFYYGVLIQANQQVDLREMFDDFQPAVTEAEYNAVQQLSGRRASTIALKTRQAFYPLRGMVICALCGYKMYAGASQGQYGKRKRYLYYRCDNKLCPRKKRSIRANVIFNYIYDVLAGGLNFTEKEYNSYYDKMVAQSGSRRIAIKTQLRSKGGALKANEAEADEIARKLLNYDEASIIWQRNNKRLEALEAEADGLGNDIKKLKRQLTDPEQDRLSLEQFLNLSKNAASKVKAANEVAKDKICRIIFLNWSVDEQKVVSHLWKEPFATLIKNRQSSTGRGWRI